MRIPIPTRFNIKHVAIFAALLFLAQQINGTTIIFSVLSLLFVILFTVAFEVAGGLVYPSGAWIFFNGVLAALVGITYKNVIGEPGQSNLQSPNVTLGAYCLGMAGMGVAAYISRTLRPRKPILAGMFVGHQLRTAAVGCLVLGLTLNFSAFVIPAALYTAVAQLNQFSVMAILLGVYYEVQVSNGTRSMNWIAWVGAADVFIIGLLGFSKGGIFLPPLAWLMPCIVLGYQFSKRQLLGFVLLLAFGFYYLVPYAQYGRSERSGTLTGDSIAAIKYLSNLNKTRQLYLDTIREGEEDDGGVHYFNQSQGFFDRLQMLDYDDALITATDQGHELGIAPTVLDYMNLIPHVFYPDKPTLNIGNSYAREIGIIPADDTVTGISFSPVGDAYHQLRWYGVALLIPMVLSLLFFVSDALTGDVRVAPWGLLSIVVFAHIAPEGLLGASIYSTVYTPLTVIVVAVLARYVMPLFSALFTGGNRVDVRRAESGRAVPLAATPGLAAARSGVEPSARNP